MQGEKSGTHKRIAFFGTPEFATLVLDALESGGMAPDTVVTAKEKPAGRGLLPRPSPVRIWAEKRGIRVLEPVRLDASDEGAAPLLSESWDIFIVAAYGKILPKEILVKPAHGVLNVHPSLLPKYRGPSPIESQILSDERTVGVSVILLDEETDHGPILAQKSYSLEHPVKRSELETMLWSGGGKLLADSLTPYFEGTLVPVPQKHGEATMTPKLAKEDGLIDRAGDGYTNYLKYLAYERWPETYFFAERGGKKVRTKIADAEYTDGQFKILRVIPEGKKEMSYADFLRA